MRKTLIKTLLLLIFIFWESVAISENRLTFVSYVIAGKEYPKYFNKTTLTADFGKPMNKERILMECGFSLPWEPDSDWRKAEAWEWNVELYKYKSVIFETNLKNAAVHSLELNQKNHIHFNKLTIQKSTSIQTIVKYGGRLVKKDTYFIQNASSDDGSGFLIKTKRNYAVSVEPVNAC